MRKSYILFLIFFLLVFLSLSLISSETRIYRSLESISSSSGGSGGGGGGGASFLNEIAHCFITEKNDIGVHPEYDGFSFSWPSSPDNFDGFTSLNVSQGIYSFIVEPENETLWNSEGLVTLVYKNKSYSGRTYGLARFDYINNIPEDFLAWGRIIGNGYFLSSDGSYFNIIRYEVNSFEDIEFCFVGYVNQAAPRISVIESWKQTITNTITNFTASITTLITKTNNYESRIKTLENKSINLTLNGTFNYWKYLNSGDRKGIVCGLAQDKHLSNLIDLGWQCSVTYRNTSRGESASCKCSRAL